MLLTVYITFAVHLMNLFDLYSYSHIPSDIIKQSKCYQSFEIRDSDSSGIPLYEQVVK